MIGIFDSGVGGLSVLKELRTQAPRADVLYFGDIANAPYGPKSTEELVVLTLGAMARLRERGVSQFVAACNSISVSVIQPIVAMFGGSPGHVIEMVEPIAREVAAMKHGRILVIATQGTVRSGLYERTFQAQGMDVELLAVPELASAIEQGRREDELRVMLLPVVERCHEYEINTLVLGCTHYPLVMGLITKMVQEHVHHPVAVIDPAAAVADETCRQFDLSGTGRMTFLLSKDSATFRGYASALFGGSAFDIQIV